MCKNNLLSISLIGDENMVQRMKAISAREDLKKLQNINRTSSDSFKQDEVDGGEYDEISYNFNRNGYQEAVTRALAIEDMFAVTNLQKSGHGVAYE